MASSRTLIKITLVIAALIISSTVLITSPIEAKSQTAQWTWNGASNVVAGYPALSPNGDLLTYSTNGTMGTIYAISPEGKDLWSFQTSIASTPRFGPDGTIYILVNLLTTTYVNGTGLAALTPGGVLKWTYAIAGISTQDMKVMPDGGVVLGAVALYPGQHSLIYLNPDGSERWTTGGPDASGAKMVYPVGSRGNNVLVASTAYGMPAASVITEYAQDGRVVRTFNTGFAPQKIFFAPDGGMRMVGFNYSRATDYQYLYALNPDGSFNWAVLLSSQIGNLVILSDGSTVYAEQTGATGSTLDNFIVDAGGKNIRRAVNGRTMPVAYGNGVLFANSTALMLLDQEGKILWKLNGDFYGQPATDGKTIYVGSGHNLVAVSESAWKVTWQPVVVVLSAMFAMIAVSLLGGTTPRVK